MLETFPQISKNLLETFPQIQMQTKFFFFEEKKNLNGPSLVK